MSPLRAIKLFCFSDCCAGDTKEHRECHLDKCPLHPFRLGHKPAGSVKREPRPLTEAQSRARQMFTARQKARSDAAGNTKASLATTEDTAAGQSTGAGGVA